MTAIRHALSLTAAFIAVSLLAYDVAADAIAFEVDNHQTGPTHSVIAASTEPLASAQDEDEFGAMADDVGDIASSAETYFDLAQARLVSTRSKAFIDGVLSLNGLYPDSDPFTTRYRFLFDGDNDPNSGSSVDGAAGIGKVMEIVVSRSVAGGPITATGSVATPGGGSSPLPTDPDVVRLEIADAGDAAAGEENRFDVPKSLLDLTADKVPVTVTAVESSGSVVDQGTMVYNRTYSSDQPQASFSPEQARPVDTVTFQVTQLTPNTTVEVTVGDDVVFTGTTDANGSVSGSFVVPELPPDAYFLIFLDGNGQYAPDVLRVLAAWRGVIRDRAIPDGPSELEPSGTSSPHESGPCTVKG